MRPERRPRVTQVAEPPGILTVRQLHTMNDTVRHDFDPEALDRSLSELIDREENGFDITLKEKSHQSGPQCGKSTTAHAADQSQSQDFLPGFDAPPTHSDPLDPNSRVRPRWCVLQRPHCRGATLDAVSVSLICGCNDSDCERVMTEMDAMVDELKESVTTRHPLSPQGKAFLDFWTWVDTRRRLSSPQVS